MGFVIISTILSFGFQDVYPPESKRKKKKRLIYVIKDYGKDLKSSLGFILKSKRMKAFILFQIVFYSVIEIVDIYNSDLLIWVGIPEQQFSMIFAILTLIGGISISLRRPIEKKFKNRTLAFLSLIHIGSCVLIGGIATYFHSSSIIPFLLLLYALQKIMTSIWYILESKYLKNFTTETIRNKITFTYEFIGGTAASIFSVLGGLLLKAIPVSNAFLFVGLIAFVVMVLTLDYMRSRFGLKPEEYAKKDLEFEK